MRPGSAQSQPTRPQVCKLLGFGKVAWVAPLLTVYKLSRKVRLSWFLKSAVLPDEYKRNPGIWIWNRSTWRDLPLRTHNTNQRQMVQEIHTQPVS